MRLLPTSHRHAMFASRYGIEESLDGGRGSELERITAGKEGSVERSVLDVVDASDTRLFVDRSWSARYKPLRPFLASRGIALQWLRSVTAEP